MALITVFTPTYNRANTLVRTYNSLCAQTCDDFEWLIIDDGSTDNTREIVAEWIKEHKIPLRYVYKDNGGLVTGYNTALEHINTELNVCVDSDDYMPDNAIEIIKREWMNVNDPEIAGLIGLDYEHGSLNPIGGLFSQTGDWHYLDKFHKVHHYCDSKVVCRTDLMKKFAPLPTFGEKDFNPIHYYVFIGETNKFRLINENLCIVDYQPDGMMAGIYRQYRQSPKSNAESRRITMRSTKVPEKLKFKAAIHYVSSSIFAKDYTFLSSTPKLVYTLFAIPFGIALNLYIRYKLFRQRKKKYLV